MAGIDMDLLYFRRSIRDPIYGYIPITELENRIIDSPAFQRLDRVCQMHSVHLVYPNAKYSRKCHSLGTMHLIHQAFTSILYRQHPELQQRVPALLYHNPPDKLMQGLDDLSSPWDGKAWQGQVMSELARVTQCMRLAGLLHDIGHAPFSHLFEHACQKCKITFDHEVMTRKIIREVLCQQDKLIDSMTADFVCQILGGEEEGLDARLMFLHELISGPMDCDMMDYMARDAYHAGTMEYGKVNVSRWIQGLVVKGGELKIEQGHVETLLSAFHALLYLYDTVYYHRTCRNFDLAMLDALTSVSDLLDDIASDHHMLLYYDDFCLLHEIRSSKGAKYVQANHIINDFLNRRKRFIKVASVNLNLNLDWLVQHEKEFKGLLNGIEGKIRSAYPLFNLRMDTRPRIRSVGLKPQKIAAWLRNRVVWSKDDGRVKLLKEVKETDLDRLRRMHVPVRVFLPANQAAAISDTQKKEIALLLANEIRSLHALQAGEGNPPRDFKRARRIIKKGGLFRLRR
ncbi:MAG: HD domain-containing protein [Desulfarculus sp.]|nr:HD domain-containing protein [Desulfarculus sp.]